jgi:hypothetical protein
MGFMDKGKLESINTEVASIKTATIAYLIDNDTAPTIADLVDDELLMKEPVGTYTIAVSGAVTGTANPYGFNWDSDAQEWIK